MNDFHYSKIAISQILEELGIPAVVTGIEGRCFDTFSIYPEPGVRVSRLISVSGPIRKALDGEGRGFRMYCGDLSVKIELLHAGSAVVAKQDDWSTEIHALVDKCEFPVALGEAVNGTLAYLDLANHATILFGGETENVSGLIDRVVTSVAAVNGHSARFSLISPQGRLRDMPVPQRYNGNPVVSTPFDALLVLQGLVQECEKRLYLLSKSGYADIWEQRHSDESPLPYVVLAIDSFELLLNDRKHSKEIFSSIVSLACQGEKTGIVVLLGQSSVPNPLIKFHFPTRIISKISKELSRTFLDIPDAASLMSDHDTLLFEEGRILSRFISFDAKMD